MLYRLSATVVNIFCVRIPSTFTFNISNTNSSSKKHQCWEAQQQIWAGLEVMPG